MLYDCLFVIFGNAWVHSGLGEALGSLEIQVSFDSVASVLTLDVSNRVSDERRRQLQGGELELLTQKYLTHLPVELVAIEGGSGFAKLARISQAVDRATVADPLHFELSSSGRFNVSVSIQLYEREGVFDAYL